MERCEYAGIPFSARFCLFYIGVDDNSVPGSRMLADIAREVAPAKAIMFDGGIVVLCFNCRGGSCAKRCLSANCPFHAKAVSQRLDALMQNWGIACGKSSCFNDLTQVHPAFKQAKAAAFLGAKAPYSTLPLQKTPLRKRIFSFDRFYIDYLVSKDDIGDGLVRKSYGCRKLAEIAEYDSLHGTDNYQFLYCYLACERRSSIVAEEYHMHRNNVKRRMDRIESLFDLDTSDPSVRFDLLFAYRILDATNVQNAPKH